MVVKHKAVDAATKGISKGEQVQVLFGPANLHTGDERERDTCVKMAYIFRTTGHIVSYELGKMILPQIEEHRHGVEMMGIFFFDDNTYALRTGDLLGERLSTVAHEQRTLLMLCDQCAIERG